MRDNFGWTKFLSVQEMFSYSFYHGDMIKIPDKTEFKMIKWNVSKHCNALHLQYSKNADAHIFTLNLFIVNY